MPPYTKLLKKEGAGLTASMMFKIMFLNDLVYLVV